MNFGQIQDQIRRDGGVQDAVVGTDIDTTIKTAINWEYQGLSGEENWYWWNLELAVAIAAGQERLSLPPYFVDLLDVRKSDGKPVHMRTLSQQLKYAERLGQINKQTIALASVDQFTYYSTGAVTIAQGSDQVTLATGTFTAAMVGRVLEIDDDVAEPYIITGYTAADTVTVDHERRGANIDGSDFTIDRAGTRRLRLEPAALESDTWTLYYYFYPPEMVHDTDEPMMPREFHRYLVAAPRVTLLHGLEERMTLYNQAKAEKAELLSKMRRRNHAGVPAIGLKIGAYAY